MKNNDALKKHHFWILFGLVPLFVLIAVFMISSSVGGKVEARNGEIDKTKKDLDSKNNAKTKGLLEYWDKLITEVDGKRGDLWKKNWEKQDREARIYAWPKSALFTGFAKRVKGTDGKETDLAVRLEDLKFGDPIPNNADQYEEFRKPEFYRALYSTSGIAKDKLPPGFVGMAESIAPTQFKSGWDNILRHVNDLGSNQKAITSDQIWLMMEDVWVQRSMLDAIKTVNEQMGEFRRVKYDDKGGKAIDDPDSATGPNDPLRRKFRSRIWEVTVEVGRRGNKQYLTGTLANITDRLQVLGIGKTMTLRVWLEGNVGTNGELKRDRDGQVDVTGIEPIEFRIGSEFLPGAGGTKTIKERDKDNKEITVTVPSNLVTVRPDESSDKEFDKYLNIIPAGKRVAEIVKVEQVFDTQTVPVRRIEAMELGRTDSRYAALGALYTNRTFAKVDTPAASTTSGDLGTGGSSTPPAGIGDPRSTGASTAAGKASGGGPIASIIDGNKRRYVEITDSVRRMPVGIVLVVDQSYIQDVLIAFANSPLRFQVTQVTWKRFRDGLGDAAGTDGSSGGGGSVLIGTPGQLGTGLGGGSGDPDAGMGFGRGSLGGRPFPPGGGSAAGPPPGTGTPPGMGEGVIGTGSGGTIIGGGSLTTVSEAQLTSGLVELSIYGIVSLYEKFATTTDPSAPKEKEEEKKDDKKDDKPKDKDPKEPVTGTTTPPKMRVRRRIVR